MHKHYLDPFLKSRNFGIVNMTSENVFFYNLTHVVTMKQNTFLTGRWVGNFKLNTPKNLKQHLCVTININHEPGVHVWRPLWAGLAQPGVRPTNTRFMCQGQFANFTDNWLQPHSKQHFGIKHTDLQTWIAHETQALDSFAKKWATSRSATWPASIRRLFQTIKVDIDCRVASLCKETNRFYNHPPWYHLTKATWSFVCSWRTTAGHFRDRTW